MVRHRQSRPALYRDDRGRAARWFGAAELDRRAMDACAPAWRRQSIGWRAQSPAWAVAQAIGAAVARSALLQSRGLEIRSRARRRVRRELQRLGARGFGPFDPAVAFRRVAQGWRFRPGGDPSLASAD